ncbi:DUF2786 domain-containing protein [Vibrio parahaemolyticus]|nr:DUF2786 domain-containing protein [Vibrio parahaemolyticus]
MNEKAISKVKKCLELSKSGNAHEAANALMMAHKLMAKYGISHTEIEYADIKTARCASTFPTKPPSYTVDLIHYLSLHFQVKPLYVLCHESGVWKRYVRFYGTEQGVELAAYAFDVFYRTVVAARKAYIGTIHKNTKPHNKTKRADVYANGWVRQACDNLNLEPMDLEYAAKIKAYIAETEGELSKLKSNHRVSKTPTLDFMRGVEDAENINLNQPIRGREQYKIN